MGLLEISELILCFLLIAIMVLAFIYWYMSYKNKNRSTVKSVDSEKGNAKTEKNSGSYTKLSVYDFMQFDKIEDNMIVQNGGSRYLMVIECDGINYDLMSQVEKTAVEAGFVQFLNTLRNQIQIYIQVKKVNVTSSINNYNSRLEKIQKELKQKENKYEKIKEDENADKKEKQDLAFEIKRLKNLYEYGLDVVSNIEKLSKNKNVLRKHYYIVVPYYASEVASELFSEEEKRNIIFSELYTRAQSLIRSLYACEMKCRILTSTDIAELLYVAYNRDESEVYSLDTALKAGYDELYVTAPDVLDKRIKALDEEIEKGALDLANQTINEVKSEKAIKVKEKEESFDDLVKMMAQKILQENKAFIGKEVAEKSIEKIEESKKQTKDKGGKGNEKTRKRKTTTK